MLSYPVIKFNILKISIYSQATGFFLGALSDMPAVKWFALYAAVSLTLNFIMQITCFVAAMAIDEQRKMKPSKKDAMAGSLNDANNSPPTYEQTMHPEESNSL